MRIVINVVLNNLIKNIQYSSSQSFEGLDLISSLSHKVNCDIYIY